ncbi:hypothetical protein YN1_7670 [Nanoarchaeota archaeon]
MIINGVMMNNFHKNYFDRSIFKKIYCYHYIMGTLDQMLSKKDIRTDIINIISNLASNNDLLLKYLYLDPDKYYEKDKYIEDLENMKLVEKYKNGYKLSELGANFQGFISYIFYNSIIIGLNVENIFKNIRIEDFVNLIDYIAEDKDQYITRRKLEENLDKKGISSTYIIKTLKLLEDLNFIVYIRKIYSINIDNIDKFYNEIKNREIKKLSDPDKIKEILEYLKECQKTIIDASEIADYLNDYNIRYIESILEELRKYKVLNREDKEKSVYIRPTRKLIEFHEKVIEPINDISNDINNLKKYSQYSEIYKENLIDILKNKYNEFQEL